MTSSSSFKAKDASRGIAIGDIVVYVTWNDMIDYQDKLSNGSKPKEPQEKSGLVIDVLNVDETTIFWVLINGQVEQVPGFLVRIHRTQNI